MGKNMRYNIPIAFAIIVAITLGVLIFGIYSTYTMFSANAADEELDIDIRLERLNNKD